MPTVSPPSAGAAVEARVFWLRFQKEIAASLIVLILGIVAFAGYRLYLYRRNSTAADLLGKAKTAEQYGEVIARYPGAPAGASAYLLLAQQQRNQKKFTESNATLQGFIEKYPQHDFVPTARLAIAANLEAVGKSNDALEIYKQVASKYAGTYNGPLALISEVPLLKAKNRTDEARRVCEEILTKYRMPGQQNEGAQDNRLATVWAGEALRQLRSLKPAEQPKLAAPPPVAKPPPLLAAPTAAPVAPPPPAGAPTPKKP